MGRAPCCDKANVKRGPWSPEEDTALKNYVEKYGTGGNWIALPQKAGLRRCGKSCRLRWLNYLRPDIKHGGFTEEEDNIICTLYNSIGSRWSVIASQLPGRTDNDVKNYWNTKLKKKWLAKKNGLNSNSSITTTVNSNKANNNNMDFSSTPSSSTCLTTKTETFDYDFSTFLNTSSTTVLPFSTGGGLGHDVNSNRKIPDPTHLSLPAGLMEPSELGTSRNNSYSVTSSQDVSGLSASPSVGMENGYGTWSGNGGGDDQYGLFMDFGSSPYHLLNGFGFQEKYNVDEATPYLANTTYTNLLATVYETKPQGLYQSVSLK
ncbi:PREDICTED: transcription factor MYB36-like [Nelumbo nucifera]|uniref:Transcription factor RAX2-like n=2 Tax=Nelumbo nucifera TaxID=4432 RepID=A0A822ZNL7_NELNU|nr:PREDICTED: transcription factor MYB36-like [Nelumbo nucifera]DAD44526.1 TPA_asm: hypothetical protein HUJ06_002756 [Nelumbo nucifera]